MKCLTGFTRKGYERRSSNEIEIGEKVNDLGVYSFVTNIFALHPRHENAVILDVLQGFVTIRRSKYS